MLPRRPLVATLFSLSLLACGDSAETAASSSGSGGSGGGATTSTGAGGALPEPKNHRPAGAPCPEDRPAGSAIDALPDNACDDDAGCTMGDNGRCVAYLGQPSFCSYDACSVDADCGSSSICECRNPGAFEANVCVHGGCQVDADCGSGGYCSPSAVTVGPDCASGIDPGSVGYFCHSPEDECVNDDDCGPTPGGWVCLFRVAEARFSCHELLCTF